MKRLGFLLILVLSFTLCSLGQRAQDSLALVALFNSTDGTNWTNNSNWLVDGQPISSWYGIFLTSGRVSSIVLNNNNLNGTIPPEIGDLTSLSQLKVSSNKLSGSIPAETGNLTSLLNLTLNNNQLSGPIPSAICNLVNLNILHLYNNQLSGSIPSEIGNMTNLDILTLYKNNLTGSIPVELADLTHLSIFQAFNNSLTGSLPHELGNLEYLTSLYLDNNQLTGSIPMEYYDLHLQTLYLNNNNFSGTIPQEIGNLGNLEYLGLGGNQFSGTLPSEIGDLTSLKILRVENNLFTGAIPAEINNLSALKRLMIHNNGFTELSTLTLTNLDSLRIHDNKFTFEDIESNVTVPIVYFQYTPQDSIGIKSKVTKLVGEDFTASVTTGGLNNQYQWHKDEVIIPLATGSIFNIPVLAASDAGSYHCAITNSTATQLTLFSRPVVLEVSTPTSIDPENGSDFKIYPIPAENSVTIELPASFAENCYIEIKDFSGKIVLMKKLDSGDLQNLELQDLNKGIYFVRIHSKNNNIVKKMVIN